MSASRKPVYVALGSSFAAGPGIQPLVSPANGRSRLNYPRLLADRLGLDLVDATSSGATTEHVLDTAQDLPNGSRCAPQIESLGPETELVTLTIGGNDVSYVLSLMRCSARLAPEVVPSSMHDSLSGPWDRDAVGQALAGLPVRLVVLLDAIAVSAPRARVVVVDYLTLLDPDPYPTGSGAPLMSDEDRQWCVRLGAELEGVTARAAEQAGVELVRASAASRHHAADAETPWVSGWEFGDLSSGGVMAYHPNRAGMAAVADLVVELLG